MVRHKFRQRESWLKIDSQQSKERSQKPRKRKIKYWCHSPESDASRNPHRRKDREKKNTQQCNNLVSCSYCTSIPLCVPEAYSFCHNQCYSLVQRIHSRAQVEKCVDRICVSCVWVCVFYFAPCLCTWALVCLSCLSQCDQLRAGKCWFHRTRIWWFESSTGVTVWRVMWTCNLAFLFYEELWIPPAEHDGIISRERQVGGQKFVAITWKE